VRSGRAPRTARRRQFDFDFADHRPSAPIGECRILLGVSETVEARPEFAGQHRLTAVVANLHDVRLGHPIQHQRRCQHPSLAGAVELVT